MATETIVATLAFGTLLAVAVFAYVSKTKVENRDKDKKSTLAADKDSHGKPVDV